MAPPRLSRAKFFLLFVLPFAVFTAIAMGASTVGAKRVKNKPAKAAAKKSYAKTPAPAPARARGFAHAVPVPVSKRVVLANNPINRPVIPAPAPVSKPVLVFIKPAMEVESFTCHDYKTPDAPVALNSLMYTDAADTLTALNGIQYASNELYVVQTPQADATNSEGVLAAFQSENRIQYIVGVPRGTRTLSWMVRASWEKMTGASAVVGGVTFDLFQKKYQANVAMTLGSLNQQPPNTKMMIVMYRHLFSNQDDGVVVAHEAPVALMCKADGDPHYKTFYGDTFDFGNGQFNHVLRSKDCMMDIQTLSDHETSPVNKTVARFDADIVRYVHAGEGAGTLQHKLKAGSTTTVKAIANNAGYVIENTELGVRLELLQGYGGFRLWLQEGYYQENVNGLCTSKPATYDRGFVMSASPPKVLCGGEQTMNGKTNVRVHESEKLWDKFDTWNTIADPREDTCTRNFCANPNMQVAPEDLPYPKTTKCAPYTIDTVTVVEDQDDETCDVYAPGKECANLDATVITAGLAKCRAMLYANPWRSDCACLRDYCQTKLDPIVQDPTTDAPCGSVVENAQHIVPVGGYDYATLDFANPKATATDTCHADAYVTGHDAQRPALLPVGWELVPDGDANVAQVLAGGNTFGTKCILTGAKDPIPIDGFEECGRHEIVETVQQDYFKCYAVRMCPSRILIRRRTHVCLDQSAPSRIGWAATVNGQTYAPVGNRGFKDKTVPEWLESAMKTDSNAYAKVVHDLNNQNDMVINFARDTAANAYYMCVTAANRPTYAAAATVRSTITTDYPYPIFWAAHDQAGVNGNQYVPVLEGTTMTARNTYVAGGQAVGYCVGPLNTCGSACLDVTFADAKGLNNVHVVGPSREGEQRLIAHQTHSVANGLAIRFCPALSHVPFGPTSCGRRLRQ